MFIGHFGLGFAAKRLLPAVPLVTLFLAAQFADVVWPVLLAMGVEHVRIDPGNTAFTPLDFVSYPYSHSLFFLALVAIGIGLSRLATAGARLEAGVLGALVVSHWVLDWITHRPDLPLLPGGARYGLGLWNSVPATVAVEATMFAGGVALYLQATTARDRVGRWGLWGLIVLLLAVYAGSVLGPPPPSVPVLIVAAIAGVIVILALSWLIDRHRTT